MNFARGGGDVCTSSTHPSLYSTMYGLLRLAIRDICGGKQEHAPVSFASSHATGSQKKGRRINRMRSRSEVNTEFFFFCPMPPTMDQSFSFYFLVAAAAAAAAPHAGCICRCRHLERLCSVLEWGGGSWCERIREGFRLGDGYVTSW